VAANIIQPPTYNALREPSNSIWSDCPVDELIADPAKGWYDYDDWRNFPLVGTQTTQIAHGRYKVFATTGSAVVPVSAVNSVELGGGILSLTTDTDNDSASIAQSYPAAMLTGLSTNSGKLWFETMIAFNTILTNTIGMMVGLAETEQWTLATGVPLNGGDAITNAASFIGFRKEEDGLGVIDSVYSDRATSFTNIGDAEATVSAANTFIKLGMKYDPANAARCVRFFADGVEMTTALSRSALVALTNLDANPLGFIMAVVADSAGTSAATYNRWWRAAQLFPN